MSGNSHSSVNPAAVPGLSQRVWSLVFARTAPICERIAGLESRLVSEQLPEKPLIEPVFIAGLARSGSTILLEALSSLPTVTSWRYSDYPAVWFPYWWNWLRSRLPLPRKLPEERAHGDRILVNPDSPEAFEEPFWMHFFPDRHQSDVDQVLDAATDNLRFEHFYPLQLRKLLAIRQASRYVCKGNYNLGRVGYIQRLFPDARFVVPVRDPVAHVASLLKQDRLFSAAAAEQPAVSRYLARSGHFEFGPQRRAECLGDPATGVAIQKDFDNGNLVSGFARQWAHSYGWLARQLAEQPGLGKVTLVVRYEDLCGEPAHELARLGEHCGLEPALTDQLVTDWAPRLSLPDYYRSGLNDADQATIHRHCDEVAAGFGY